MKRLRCFAIVPAAGASRRMGSAKLLLPYRGGTLIEATLRAWRASRVERTVVIVRRGDAALIDRAKGDKTELVVPPIDPAEMKISVQHGLRHVEKHHRPKANDAWLLAPADLPRLSPRMIDAVIEAYASGRGRAVVPSVAGRRGHPVLFPWSRTADVFTLGQGEGIDRLLSRIDVETVTLSDPSLSDPSLFEDIDRPEDYKRLLDG